MSRFSRLFEKFRPAPAGQEKSASEPNERRWVIVGLGNPGEQYQRSRHNLGFRSVQRLAARHNQQLSQRKFNGLFNEIHVDAGDAIVLMPQTFYNRSGDCVTAILGYYKVPPERLIVIHDEMDLQERQIRLKRGGGDAGNRGVRSIAEALGTADFYRIRIGIAHPGGSQGSIDYLLQPLTDDELRTLEPVFERAGEAALAIMREGLDRARSVYNQRV